VETTGRIHRRELQCNSDLDAVLEVIAIVAFRHGLLATGSECEPTFVSLSAQRSA
jgi:hypothetical protein